MTRSKLLLVGVFVAGGLAGLMGTTLRQPAAVAQPPAPPAPAAPPAQATEAEAGIKAITAEYAKAFNANDAKAASLLWTDAGEFVGADGERAVGRDQIARGLAEFFKENPKTTAEVVVESVQQRSRGVAIAEGVIRVKLAGQTEAGESRYTAIHVLEDGKWLAASVTEWVPDPALDLTLKNFEWLLGEWSAKGNDGAEVKLAYSWDEDKAFITGKYAVTKDGKTVSKGTQVFGVNQAGGLRSWMFDSTGTTSEAVWVRDEKRWVNETTGVLPDGSEVTSVNVIVPLGPDAFTWQTTERTVNGVPADPFPPLKVTRVKK